MAFPIPQPHINSPTAEGQLAQLKSYLLQFVEQMQWILNTLEKGHLEVVDSSFNTEMNKWSYVKYSNGTYQLQGAFSVTPTGTGKSDAWYRTTRIGLKVPFDVKTAMVTGNTNGYSVITSATKDPDRDNGIVFRLLSDKDLTDTKVTVRLMVVGQY